MRVMVFVKATEECEAGILPSRELLAQMGSYNEELVKAGVTLAGEGLQPSSKGVRVKFSGPFPETKELISGFWIWQVKSMADAIEWLKRAPFGGEAEIEIRAIVEAEDFGKNLTPGLREREQRLRDQIARKA
jgi:hypothetical protein